VRVHYRIANGKSKVPYDTSEILWVFVVEAHRNGKSFRLR